MLPVLAMLGAVALSAASLVGGKYMLDLLAPSEFLAVRLGQGALWLWLLVIIRLPVAAWRRVDRRILLMGLLDPGLVAVLMIYGLLYSTAITASVMWSLMPLAMPILGRVFLKETVQPSVLAAAGLAIAGSTMLAWGQASAGTGSWVGVALIVAGVASACANQLIARKVAVGGGLPLVTTTYQITIAALLALGLIAVERPEIAVQALDWGDIGLILVLSVAGGAGPFLLYNYALRTMQVGRISLFAPLVGPVGAVMAMGLIGEALPSRDAAAIGLVLFAAFLPNLITVLKGRR